MSDTTPDFSALSASLRYKAHGIITGVGTYRWIVLDMVTKDFVPATSRTDAEAQAHRLNLRDRHIEDVRNKDFGGHP